MNLLREPASDEVAERGRELRAWVADHYELPGGGGMHIPQTLRGVPDPQKYVWPRVLARLSESPSDPWSLAMIRQFWCEGPSWAASYYHFAAVGLIRALFQFPEAVGDLRDSVLERSALESQMLDADGTENHLLMWRTSGYLFAEARGDEAARRRMRAWLLSFADRLVKIGEGEFDSSTYAPFGIAPLSNLFDFAGDPEVREAARSALDFYARQLALKNVGGVLVGAESRGGATKAFGSNASISTWLWWGGAPYEAVAGRSSAHLIVQSLSDYRPPAYLQEMSDKRRLGEPVSYRAAKPDYHMTAPCEARETLWFSSRLGLGALYTPQGGWAADNQTSLWRAATLAPDGFGLVFAGGSSAFAIENRFNGIGRGPFDQVAQAGPTLVFLHRVPENAEELRDEIRLLVDDWSERSGGKARFQNPTLEPWCYLRVPISSACVVEGQMIRGETAGCAWTCHALAGDFLMDAAAGEIGDGLVFRTDYRVGELGGFVLEFSGTETGKLEFLARAAPHPPVRDGMTARYVSAEGTRLEVTYQSSGAFIEPTYDWGPAPAFPSGEGHGKVPDVRVNGVRLPLDEAWPVLKRVSGPA